MTNIKKFLITLSTLLNYISCRILFNESAKNCYLEKKGTRGIVNCPPLVNDPQFINQWTHVPRPFRIFDGRTPVDLGILDVWIKHGYFGYGVNIVINDDGVSVNHTELKSRVNLDISYDFYTDSADLRGTENDYHETKVAGVVGMEINNVFCGVGVAPEATIGFHEFNLVWNIN